MGPGDSHPAFGYTTFRDEPKESAKSKVKIMLNVPASHMIRTWQAFTTVVRGVTLFDESL